MALHILQTTIFNFWYLILMAILLYYSTVIYTHFNYICILVLTTLKMAT